MKTDMKRVLSFVMALCLCITMLPAMAMQADAATLTETEFAEKIAYLKTVYKDYGYWNNYNSCGYEGTGSTKCPSCSGSCSASCTDQCGKFYLNGNYYGGQCFGFANKMAYLVFGSVPDKSTDSSHTWTYSTSVSNYYAGDYVRVRNDSHSIFITAVNGDTITYVDCNNIGSCQVKWDRTISKSSLQSITTYVYHLPGNTLTGTGSSSSSGTTTTTHTANTAYSAYLPVKAYPISTGNITVYDVNGTAYSNRYITGSSDLCTIKAVYTDGWCWVEYPSSAEADGYFDAYVKWSVFSGGTSPSSWTSTGNYTAYRRSDLSATIGSVSNGDKCLVVNTSGNLKQVMYPVTSSGYWKMGWINVGSTATTTDSDFPTPILAYNYSADTKTTVYQYTSTLGGTSYGTIFVDDLCTINSVSISGNWVNVTYPVSSGTKTGYVYLNQFFPSLGNISKPYSTKVSANTTAYRKADMATSIGTVYPSDTLTVVGKSGNLYQVLYPVTEGSNAGKYKLGWIYGDNIVKNLVSITVTTKPAKTVYLEGESFSSSGMVVTATYDDGSTAAVTGYTVSGYTSTPGSKTITITYGGKTTAIDVTVKSKSPTALSITTKPTDTSYFVGEDFNTSGMIVKATYDNGTTSNVTDYYVSYDFSSAGAKTVTVSYKYNGVTVSTTLSVTVVNPTISSIAVKTKPSKTSYYVGDTLNTSGLTLTASYNDGSTETVSSGFTCSPTTLSTAGTQTITVSYGGKTTTFTVTVTAVTLSSISVASNPAKTSYYVGDTLNTSGLTLKATYNNGTTQTISSGFTCSPTSLSTAGTQTITVSYGGKTATFTVTVKELPAGAMSVSKVSGAPGKTVTVAIKLDSNPGIIAARLKIAYDSEALTLMEVKDGGILGEDVFGGDLSANPYIVTWENGLATSDYTATGTLVYLTFKIAEDAPAGKLPITVSYDPEEIYNKDQTNVAFSITQGAITVEESDEVDPNAPQIVVSDSTGMVGQQVSITIALVNNPGVASMILSVGYDDDVLTLVSVTDGGQLGTAVHSDNYAACPYTLTWANDLVTENYIYNGEIVTLTFEVAEDAELGQTSVTVYYDYDNFDIFNVDGEEVWFEMVDGSVNVIDVLIGDVNSDGKVNTQDRMILTRYLAKWTGYTEDMINMTAADVNCDGKVNTQDRMILTRYLAKWTGYEELPYSR